MTPPSIRIIGAGLSGLTLGQCLRRRNVSAVIYDHVKKDPTRNNYGITLYKSTYKPLLDILQISEDDFRRQVGVQHPDSGAVVSDGQKLRVNRAALTNLLESDLDVRNEHKFMSNLDVRKEHKFTNVVSTVQPENNSSRYVSIKTGTEVRTDEFNLLVAADGVHSAVRSWLNLSKPAFDLEVLPYIVYNGKRRMAYSNLPSGLLDCFANPDGIRHSQKGVLLTIKADFWDPDQQTVAVSYTLSRVALKADQPKLDRHYGAAWWLAMRYVEEVASLGPLPAPFDGVFNEETMKEDRLLHWLMRSSLVDDKTINDTALNRGIVLLGDAAHAQPIPGNGANLAIDDALELTKHISATGDVDIAAFLKARRQAWVDGKRESEHALVGLDLW